jgi:putative Ca2+/H+ antiporter (TMEM165/GDT1 family)
VVDTLALTRARPGGLRDAEAGETFDPGGTPGRGHASIRPDRGTDDVDALTTSFLVSFGVIFVAELGDKSQLMAITFASRYNATQVLVGISLATAVVHALSVGLGYGLGANLPTAWVSLAAALAFVGFGIWTVRGDSLSETEKQRAQRSRRAAIIAVTVAFFLAELGDKTMLATVTLATHHESFGTWFGSTLGMVAADAVAILVGHQLGKRLPERAVRYGAAALFVVIGLWLLADAVPQLV